jgi:hypothetical protein
VIAARLLGIEETWNHPPLFAYADRIITENLDEGTNSPSPFVMAMWKQYSPKP